jgi:prophage regulatory protein
MNEAVATPRLADLSRLKAKGIPYSEPHLRRLETQGDFPRRVTLGERRVAWVEQEIDEWIAARIAARDEVAA